MFKDYPTAMFMPPIVMLMITPDDLRSIASLLDETWLKSSMMLSRGSKYTEEEFQPPGNMVMDKVITE